ncbi:hypothetical protein A1F94_007946 [Pyrenophora tritici-repentis]|nr:hypothetical protein A1F94_007946 [Pyrenophora tritici-repentis]
MLEDESKDLEATEIDQTKFGKMAMFEGINRPPTPYIQEEEFYKLARQINQLLRHLNKAKIEYACEEHYGCYATGLLPIVTRDAIRSWEEPTLPISEEEKQEIYDELCQTRNDWKTFQHGHKKGQGHQ